MTPLPLTCPIHGRPLVRKITQYGPRWKCTEAGCTVCCWEGRTSTPADLETRTLRSQCHKLFDPLWQRGSHFARPGAGGKKLRRREAYTWLAKSLGIDVEQAHFGMFDAEKCRQALEAINALRSRRDVCDTGKSGRQRQRSLRNFKKRNDRSAGVRLQQSLEEMHLAEHTQEGEE